MRIFALALAGSVLLSAACGSKTAPAQPPAAPSGLAATGGNGQIALTWDAVTAATSYLVARSDASGGAKAQIAAPSTNTYTDTGLGNGVAKFYVVRAVGPGGTSADSAEVTATTLSPPPAPTNVHVTAFTTHALVTWNASATASSYDVLRAPGGTSSFAVVGSGLTTTQDDDAGLSAGTAYSYVVRANNAAGTSANSSPAQNVTTAALPPTGLAGTDGNHKVKLSWTASTGATGYDVLRSTTLGVGYASVGTTTGASAVTFTDATALNGTTYYYIVRAVSSGSESDDAGPVTSNPHREICVADQGTNIISVFNGEQSGNLAPLRSYGSLTGLARPALIAMDVGDGEYYVASPLQTVVTHARTSTGNVAPLRTLSGGVTGMGGIAADFAHQQLLVGDGAQVKTFSRTASGSATPVQTLQLPSGASASEIALSGGTSDRLFVLSGKKIYIYGRADSGTTPPTGTITIASTNPIAGLAYDATADQVLVIDTANPDILFFAADGSSSTPARKFDSSVLFSSTGLGVDPVNHIIYVVDSPSVFAFPEGFTCSGSPTCFNANLTPSWTLAGSNTQMAINRTQRIAVDTVHSEIAVLNNSGRILTFGLTASGNTAPTRVIGSTSTGIEAPMGLRADVVNGNLYVANNGQVPGITVHPIGASGNAAPVQMLGGTTNANTGLSSGVIDVEIDVAHGEMFAVPNNSATKSINIFALTANGDVAPSRKVTGLNTLITSPGPLGYDAKADAIVLGQGNRIDTYARTFASGNEAPLTTITGASTGLVGIGGLFVDEIDDEIAAINSNATLDFFSRTATGNVAPRSFTASANSRIYVDATAGEVFVTGNNVIDVYPRTASGGAQTPLRRISGTATGLFQPTGIAVCN
jgi:fibronectin type 3 domain-containing protein